MTIKQITDHAAAAQARLPSQFIGATKLQALIGKIGERAQGIETVLFDLLNNRALSTATGLQLDNLGTILDTARTVGETDDSYRARLFSATSQLQKSGEPEHLIEIFNFLLNPDSMILQEIYPAGVQLTAHDDTDPESFTIDSDTREAMDNVKAAGIELILQMATTSDYFMMADESETDVNGDGPDDALHGLGDETLTEGGALARVFGYPFEITNMLAYSEQFDHADWVKMGTPIITANTDIAPDGTLTASTIEDDDAVTEQERIRQDISSFDAKQNYTASIYIKKDSTPRATRFVALRIKYLGSSDEHNYLKFDTSTGEYDLSVADTSATVNIVSDGDYWRIALSAKSQDAANTQISLWFHPASGASTSWAYSSTATGSAVIWGAQLVKGSYPGPYVKTTNSPVTRLFNG